ncbi:Serine carboxypeptidase-like 2, partial [Mucuna pruriens]
MAKFSSSYSRASDLVYYGVILPFLVFSFQLAWCGSIVKFLPGLEGPLPFVLETGSVTVKYVGVGESEDVQAFYYFIESENNPIEDPLLLWLSGGPGCSSFSGLAFEIGPFAFKVEEYNGSRPNFSIIFVDLPVSTGFTYARTEFAAAQRSDWMLVHHVHQFLRKWLIDHPKFLSNEVYIGGDSYSGIPVPAIVQEISQGNEKGVQPWINLQGYLLGNALTTREDENYAIPFAHGMGLISDELYESLQKNCKGEYINVETRNVLCSRDIESFDEVCIFFLFFLPLVSLSNFTNESTIVPLPQAISGLDGPIFWTNIVGDIVLKHLRNYVHFLCNYWTNDDNVRSSLHIRKGSIGQWIRCSFDIPYTMDISSSFDHHVNLSRKGYRSLIYSGDHDFLIPFLSTQAWIRSLNYSIVDDWRQWHTNGQGGGHTAPEYKPEECFAMYSRWISNTAL